MANEGARCQYLSTSTLCYWYLSNNRFVDQYMRQKRIWMIFLKNNNSCVLIPRSHRAKRSHANILTFISYQLWAFHTMVRRLSVIFGGPSKLQSWEFNNDLTMLYPPWAVLKVQMLQEIASEANSCHILFYGIPLCLLEVLDMLPYV